MFTIVSDVLKAIAKLHRSVSLSYGVCGFAVRGVFCAVFWFSQNFGAVFRSLTFLQFALSSIFVQSFVFFRTVFTEISSGYSVLGTPLTPPPPLYVHQSHDIAVIMVKILYLLLYNSFSVQNQKIKNQKNRRKVQDEYGKCFIHK